ncbi:cation diffusion facilitator family transporter [Eubacterium aggregans]|uniref:cation diffusion facilitator family transporter n=1 Tax=Eubacterium aggregans TaxID=81409 RepID=UPI0030B8648E
MNKQIKTTDVQQENKKIAMRVSVVSIIINIALSILKFVIGVLAHSGALISDAVHSASDVLSTFVVIVGVNVSSKEKDEGHQYGHDRLECVAAIFLAVILCLTGLGIGWAGIEKIIGANTSPLEVPGMLALVAAAISIVVKEWMYWYTRGAAKKINSGALQADAWHHRSDALSSIGSLVGIAGARLGYPILDPLAAVVIALMVIKVAFDIGKDSISKMLDTSVDKETEVEIRQLVAAYPKVEGIDDLRTRTFGSSFYVDLEIAMDGAMSLQAAHSIAEEIHDALEEKYPTLKHCMIHVNPAGNPKERDSLS